MTVSISGNLIGHVRKILDESLIDSLSGKAARHGTNAATLHGLSAYILAAASIEAVMNESFLGGMTTSLYKECAIWKMGNDWLKSLELTKKLLLVPQMLFGATFEVGSQPYQDFCLLVRIRNDLLHYKMGYDIPKYVRHLTERGIALTACNREGADYAWPHKLSCTHGILWAHNTACHVASKLESLIPEDKRSVVFPLSENYKRIPESFLEQFYAHAAKQAKKP